MLEWYENASQGWLLTTLSSLLCVLGCFIIFLDDVYYFVLPRTITAKFPFHLKENYSFMNGSLAFSCGCLLLTALYRLLPEAMTYLASSDQDGKANTVLVVSFIAGIIICILFNNVLHLLTAESVVHCSHGGEGKIEQMPSDQLHISHVLEAREHPHQGQDGLHLHCSSSAKLHSHHSHDLERGPTEMSQRSFDSHHHGSPSKCLESDESNANITVYEGAAIVPVTDANDLERQPLLAHKKSSGLAHFLAHGSTLEEQILGECKGYSSAERKAEDDTRENILEMDDTIKPVVTPVALHSHHDSDEHHHHHVNSPYSRLLLIGIQTIFAITLHKFPEGFITYITSETNPQLGFSIFLSLLIHNYTEGFLMCLPLYYSFGDVKWRKLKAVGISATLGGLSQPMGAFLGYLFMRYYGKDSFDVGKLNYVFGISMAVTSGFLVVIALSMYGSSVSFSARPNFVLVWCLIGMGTIGVLTIFTSH
ncbi:hypothetical protein METBIDRAFT_14012 [Metschnikowia bicuspidata var. bicuspidata NRRL YB-4993]|uniref:Zinc/iron permease n=1 Tax=Metschnikowia bicuspidata var. bicuspidata NRRL YB-4993 TaxID=869754 RepID=A0A1A0GZ18_9ASCO|nr:hypothetical protein METBIDRAFT_14012 [Metschnikowia bicuspidata var. bicuspidata NRRL YB-4993]OBA17019.1 hypothetical protein METBIDRAFT_14012 [Metschnikowia bicuspidata var. bicuspidata NRRL YB-4993]